MVASEAMLTESTCKISRRSDRGFESYGPKNVEKRKKSVKTRVKFDNAALECSIEKRELHQRRGISYEGLCKISKESAKRFRSNGQKIIEIRFSL